jgi:hypothetical protein
LRRHTTTQHGSSQESTPSTAGASYDTIGHCYHEFRRPDPHIASAIRTPSGMHRASLSCSPGAAVAAIPVPRECTIGFMAAFLGRPEAYLDARVRAATSPWHQVPPAAVTRALDRLRRDLAHGWWDRRYGHLRQQAELDVGLRLVSLEASATRMARRAI